MDSNLPSGNETRVRRAALVTIIALSAAWSSAALSRTQPATDCNGENDLQTLSAPVDALVLDTVDHVPTEPNVSDLDGVDIDTVARVPGTPLLNLAPSVNIAIRDIFEADNAAPADETSLEIPVSPVAESEELPDLSELPETATNDGVAEEESGLPLLERRMYRIDI